MNKDLSAGTRVRIKEHGRMGVVVPDLLGICPDGSVLIEIDQTPGVSSIRSAKLEVVEVLEIEFCRGKCPACIFCQEESCARYSALRLCTVVSALAARIVPQRSYPFCQDEVAQALTA